MFYKDMTVNILAKYKYIEVKLLQNSHKAKILKYPTKGNVLRSM